jgi:fatty-acyl-CoA synthase
MIAGFRSGRESAAKMWLRALEMTSSIAGDPKRIFPAVVEELAEKFGDAPALLSDRESLTYRTLAERSNRYSRWALVQGIAKGDNVCLLMPNRPEYMAIWLGITRIGGVVSLLNTNLIASSLAHCINIVEPAHVIVAAELIDKFATAQPHLANRAKVWSFGEGPYEFSRIDLEIEEYSGETLTNLNCQPPGVEDRALYIYTSGTTGLPKAANINHHRVMVWSHWFAGMIDTGPSDRMYDCLPMYHSVGGVVAVGAMLVSGGSVVIREKFSARQFWDDVINSECTVFQYIGELCRYLLHTPRHPREAEHRIRLCCGNGLRVDIWNDFKTRFRIPRILEFYAATEGNVSLFNAEGKPGSIGRIPLFLGHRFPAALVKIDIAKEEPVRNEQGFCIGCAPNEVGEAIGKINDGASNLASRFEGYTDSAETEKKILRDVFKRHDAWFRTGDLMRRDEQGFFYFVDRIGDTFRWKGENVATSEVSEVISACPGIIEAIVYGVTIPRRDGRVGMAAAVISAEFNLIVFREHLLKSLPEYARPMFLRIRSELDITATFKQKKSELIREGFDPSATSDAIYFNNPERQAFVPLDKVVYDRILTEQVPL